MVQDSITRVADWVATVNPAALMWPAAVLVALCFGLVLFGVVQYQAFNRRWGMHLVLGLAGGAVVVGLGAAIHWLLGVLYGLGYVLTWLVWVLTGRWRWWRRALARGLTAGLALGPWLWLGATEKAILAVRGGASDKAKWLLAPSGLMWFWMMLGALWLLVLVGGWGCWRWPREAPRPVQQADMARLWRRRLVVAAWAVLGLLGLNWYAAGRVDLLAACEKAQHWRLSYVLVSRPGSAWYRATNGRRPLHAAAWGGCAGAVHLLVAAGAAVNAKDEDGWTALHLAARAGRRASIETVHLLLAAGAAVDARDKDGATPLHRAADWGQADAARLLLAASADVNAKDDLRRTPLRLAAEQGHAEVVCVLLAAGAEANARDADGSTPLHEAARGGHAEAVRRLLAAGAAVNAETSSGWTPLHWAAERGDASVVPLLLEAGAAVNAKDADGSTPLHWATSNGNAEAVRLLLAAGARVNERNAEGATPMDWPHITDECRTLLRQAGGKTGAEMDAAKATPAPEPAPPEPGR